MLTRWYSDRSRRLGACIDAWGEIRALGTEISRILGPHLVGFPLRSTLVPNRATYQPSWPQVLCWDNDCSSAYGCTTDGKEMTPGLWQEFLAKRGCIKSCRDLKYLLHLLHSVQLTWQSLGSLTIWLQRFFTISS